jgi:hypothetical protein
LSVVILCAIAATSFAADADKLRALIIDGQNNHDWKRTTPLLKKALESSGRFTVGIATSPPEGMMTKDFRPKFREYDVVVC